MTTTATVKNEQQSLNQDFASFLMDINFEIVKGVEEMNLDRILSNEFKQGIASDVLCGL